MYTRDFYSPSIEQICSILGRSLGSYFQHNVMISRRICGQELGMVGLNPLSLHCRQYNDVVINSNASFHEKKKEGFVLFLRFTESKRRRPMGQCRGEVHTVPRSRTLYKHQLRS
jgi:hypothetical protein